MTNLAVAHIAGEGIDRDDAQAMQWLKRAATLDNPNAQTKLGFIYSTGDCGVEVRLRDAVLWFQLAADQGHPLAQEAMAEAFRYGRGVEQNCETTVLWYTKAALQGQASSQHALGVCYLKGEGTAKNPREAVKWWRRAAAQWDAKAQHSLGVAYATGVGVPTIDTREAERWHKRAAEQGHAGAKEALKVLAFTPGSGGVANGDASGSAGGGPSVADTQGHTGHIPFKSGKSGKTCTIL